MAIDIIIESQVSQTITDGVTDKAPSENAVFDALANKVDKETGKGLSEEDFTMAEKNKLAGIEADAEVNVNADWNATSGDAEILNKPTIPDVALLVPYTGAVADVDLGTHKLTAQDLVVNHSSGSGDAATITKGGNGEALKVVKSSGSGNAASITGGVTLLEELKLTTKLADTEIASAATWNAKLGGAVAIGQVAFGTATGVIGGDSGLFWDNVNKRLGVGTSAPTQRLSVNGSINLLSPTSYIFSHTGNIMVGQDSFGNYLFAGTNAANTPPRLFIGRMNTSIEFQTDGGNERMRIASGGNVLIGTPTDAGFRLDVNGTARFGATTVRASGALSTDIAFRVRNSANTFDIIRAQGDGSVFVGLGAGNSNTGANNSFFGANAGRNNTTGSDNTANGGSALRSNTTGAGNTANGVYALQNNTTGLANTANGYFALQNNTTGSGNIAFGTQAGRFIADGTTANTIANNSVFLGLDTKALANNQTNQIVIGHNAIGAGSNTVTLGNTSIIKTILRGTLNAANLPTSATGLVAGDIWNDAGTLKIV